MLFQQEIILYVVPSLVYINIWVLVKFSACCANIYVLVYVRNSVDEVAVVCVISVYIIPEHNCMLVSLLL